MFSLEVIFVSFSFYVVCEYNCLSVHCSARFVISSGKLSLVLNSPLLERGFKTGQDANWAEAIIGGCDSKATFDTTRVGRRLGDAVKLAIS